MGFLNGVVAVFSYISGLGNTVMMPIIITVMGCLLGAGFGKSLRGGLTVGVGFIGLNLVTGLLGSNLGPAVQAMVGKYGLTLDAIDIGWVPASAIAFASQVGTFIIPLGLVINIIMLITNTTQTANVDIWNYWHFAFTGAMVQSLTGSLVLGLITAALNMIIIMVIADRTAEGLGTYNGLPGISLPHGFTAAFVPIAFVANWILDKIPGLNKLNVDMDTIQRKLGVFGEPMIVGTFIGIIIGILANELPFGQAVGPVLGLGVTMGAVLVLIPKMAAMLMEGLIPVSDAAEALIEKKFSNRGKMYIGLDSAVGTGHPVALTCALILIPASIFLAVLLPGNRVLPFADLAVMPFVIVLIIPVCKGDFLRSLISGLVVFIVMLYCGTDLVDLLMETAAVAQPEVYANYGSNFSSICDGSNPLTWAMVKLGGLRWIGMAIMAAIAVVMAIWNRKCIIKEAAALHAEG